MKEFEKNNNFEREKFIKFYFKKLKLNPELKKEQIKLINNQIINSRNFYERLLKTKNGYNKIVNKFNIGNKIILKRLELISKKNQIDKKLIIKEKNSFKKI